MTKTLKDLFLSGNYPGPYKTDTTPISDDSSYDVDPKGAFLGKEDWQFGTDYRGVGSDGKVDFSIFGRGKIEVGKNTPNIFLTALDVVEADTNPKGIRISSGVELNNPRIYGNEAVRIALRTTPALERMRNGSIPKVKLKDLDGFGDLVTGARNLVNSITGKDLPTPTYVANYLDKSGNSLLESGPISLRDSQIQQIKSKACGTTFGDILSKSIGPPNIAAKQALGATVSAIKSEVRNSFFDDTTGPVSNRIERDGVYLTNQNQKYSSEVRPDSIFGKYDREAEYDLNRSTVWGKDSKGNVVDERPTIFLKNSPIVGLDRPGTYCDLNGVSNGRKNSFLGHNDTTFTDIDVKDNNRLEKIKSSSPIYGTNRTTFGTSIDYAFEDKENPNYPKQMFSVQSKYPDQIRNGNGFSKTLEETEFGDASNVNGYTDGMNSKRTIIINSNTQKTQADTDNFFKNTGNFPFWFRDVRNNTTLLFRATIKSFSETITPSWEAGNFVGNPYQFQTYSGVSRTLSFGFTIYTLSPDELAVNWNKIQYLTQMTYPIFRNNNKLFDAPIIRFSIGDVFKNRYAVITDLSYSVEEDSRWETVPGAQVPKLIEVNSMTLALLEDIGSENRLHDFSYNSPDLNSTVKSNIKNQRQVVTNGSSLG